MKINLALITSIIVAVGLVAFGFTAVQISSDREQLKNELEVKTIRVAEDFYKAYFSDLELGESLDSSKITDSIINRYGFTGVALYLNQDSIIALNNDVKPFLQSSTDYISQAISADSSIGRYITLKGDNYFEYTRVIKKVDLPAAAVVFFADARYIGHIINSIWFHNFWRWFLQALVISIVTLLIVRWGILSPIKKLLNGPGRPGLVILMCYKNVRWLLFWNLYIKRFPV
jgi:hypothetical protein